MWANFYHAFSILVLWIKSVISPIHSILNHQKEIPMRQKEKNKAEYVVKKPMLMKNIFLT